MTKLSLDHVALPVYDAAATHAFYSEFLGLPLVEAHTGEDWGGRPWLMMIYAFADGREIAMVELKGEKRPPRKGPRDLPHFAFSAPDHAALEAWIAKIEAAKLDHWLEDHGAQRSVYFEDPNGIVLEITAPPSAPGGASAHAERIVAAWTQA